MRDQADAHLLTLHTRWFVRSKEIEKAHLDRLAFCIEKWCHAQLSMEYSLIQGNGRSGQTVDWTACVR